VELDDLDIDFATSIVVVEWGRGMVDGITESWLDIEIERPTGASQAPGTTEGSDPVSGMTDAEFLGADEPRTVTITAYGPRWSSSDWA
jgi:tRNA threonylcarbamoyladenosine biosynthesis protein TsaE